MSESDVLRFPPIYPWSAFDDRRFLRRTDRPLTPVRPSPEHSRIHGASKALERRLLSEFDRVAYERAGVLAGEYIVLADGLFLLDRNGACVSVNFPWDAPILGQHIMNAANGLDLWAMREDLDRQWEALPLVESAAVFSHVYHGNYYHYSYEFLQKCRVLREFAVDKIIVPAGILNLGFQRDLFARAAEGWLICPIAQPVRVKDPVVIEANLSAEGVHWLRTIVPERARSAGRRIYLRRPPSPNRRANNIADTPEFLEMLASLGFETIDFGGGENSIPRQIEMLDGASTLLACHGAGLTNITYMSSPAHIIEVFGRSVISSSFMQISGLLGFDHDVILGEENEAGEVVVDCTHLRAIIERS